MTRYPHVTGERVTPNSNTTRDGTSKMIEKIVIDGSKFSEGRTCRASVSLLTQVFTEPVGVRLSGERSFGIAARTEIEGIIDRQRQWYSFVSMSGNTFFVIMNVVATLVASSTIIAFIHTLSVVRNVAFDFSNYFERNWLRSDDRTYRAVCVLDFLTASAFSKHTVRYRKIIAAS
jgi:hypothetical protein